MTNLEGKEQLFFSNLVRAIEPVQAELSLSQFLALCRVAIEPGLSVNDLAERMRCPQQTASRHVAALLGRYETYGDADGDSGGRSKFDPLIAQEISQNDPRKRALFVSNQGRILLKKIVSQFMSGAKK